MKAQKYKGNSESGISEAQDHEEYTPTGGSYIYHQYNNSLSYMTRLSREQID